MRQSHPFILASGSPQRKTLLEQMGIEVSVLPAETDEDHSREDSARELVEVLALDKMIARLATPLPRGSQTGNPYDPTNTFILAADTIVAIDEHRLGKPVDETQAELYLRKLSGRVHQVHTAFSMYIPRGILNPGELGEAYRQIDRERYNSVLSSTHTSAESPISPKNTQIEIPSTVAAALADAWFDAGMLYCATATTDIRVAHLSDEEIRSYLELNEWQGAAGGYRIQGRAGCHISEIRGSYTNIVGLPIELVYGIIRCTSFRTGK